MKDQNIEKDKNSLQRLFEAFSKQKNKRDFYIDLEKYLQYIKKSTHFSKIASLLEKEIRDNLKQIHPETREAELKKMVDDKTSKKGKIDVTDEYNKLIKKFEDERNKSYWGAWERLLWVYFALSDQQSYPDYELAKSKKLKKEGFVFERAQEYLHFCFELEEIVGYKIVGDEQRTTNLLNIISEYGNKRDDPNEIEFFRNYAKRIHTYFINKIEKTKTKTKTDKIDIFIQNYLIYKTPNKEPSYKLISPIRKGILDYLLRDENRRVLREELAIYLMKTNNPSESQKMRISRDVRDMNDHFKEVLGFPIKEEQYSLIEPSKKRGHKMNNKKFNFIVDR